LPSATLRELRTAFDKYDSDRSGSITQKELATALTTAGVAPEPHAIASAFSKADTDGDGKITFAEFIELHIKQRLQAEKATRIPGTAVQTEAARAAAARAIQQRVREQRASMARGSSRDSTRARAGTHAHFGRPLERSSQLRTSTSSLQLKVPGASQAGSHL
jgi:hypothetical protein